MVAAAVILQDWLDRRSQAPLTSTSAGALDPPGAGPGSVATRAPTGPRSDTTHPS